MIKEQVLRLIELRIESEDRAEGLTAAERQEYDRLWAVLDAWRELDLRSLLEMAEEVGCLKREWQEAEEKWEECKRHPYYRTEADTDKLYYDQLRATLYAAAGIPETEEITPERENEGA